MGGGWLLAVFRHAFSYRQRWGLDMAKCAIPLEPWGLYYISKSVKLGSINIELSLAGGFLWQSAVCGPPIGPMAPAICYPHRRLSPHPDAPDRGVMACHSLTRTQADPLL